MSKRSMVLFHIEFGVVRRITEQDLRKNSRCKEQRNGSLSVAMPYDIYDSLDFWLVKYLVKLVDSHEL